MKRPWRASSSRKKGGASRFSSRPREATAHFGRCLTAHIPAIARSDPALAEALPLPCRFTESNADELARKARYLLALPEREKRRIGAMLREYVVEHHTLAALASEVRRQFDTLSD